MGSFRDIEDAIQLAIVHSSGLPSGSVIWAYQNSDAPPNPYISISLDATLTRGIDYVKTTVDMTRPRGQEVKQEIKGLREIPLELQCFSDPVTGDDSARALLSTAVAGLLLPSIRSGLRAVGFSPFDPGPVGFAPEIVAAGFRGRSFCSIRSLMPAPAVAEYVGIISTMRGTIGGTGSRQLQTIFGRACSPGADAGAGVAWEVATTFTSSVDGLLTKILFFKNPGNTGAHIGHVWIGGNPTPLAAVPFTVESASGWQAVTLPTPLRIVAGIYYAVGYSSSTGYAATPGGSAGAISRPPLSTPLSFGSAAQGPPGTFPVVIFDGTNYWVDLEFETGPLWSFSASLG